MSVSTTSASILNIESIDGIDTTVRVSAPDGTIAVFFSPAEPAISRVGRVMNVIDGTLSVIQRVQNVVDGTLTTISRVDRVMNVVDGTIGVENITRLRNLVDGTVSLVTRVDRVFNLVDGTVSVSNRPDVQRVHNLVAGTVTVSNAGFDVNNRPDVNRVFNLVDGTVSVSNRPDVQRVHNIVDGTVTVNAGTGTLTVRLDPGYTLGAISNTGFNVNNSPTVTANAGTGMFNTAGTASIFTVSGSTSGVSTSGVTLISPSTAYSFKIFAYSIQTTGIVSLLTRFTNGSGASPTEFWRPLVTPATTTSAPVGANLMTAPPSYIFSTGVNTTLSLLLDTATLVHYSVSYIKESA